MTDICTLEDIKSALYGEFNIIHKMTAYNRPETFEKARTLACIGEKIAAVEAEQRQQDNGGPHLSLVKKAGS